MNHLHKRLNEKSCSKGMKIRHVRLSKEVQYADALTFMAADRGHVEEAYSGDIIGIHNHGTIRIGDTLITLFSAQSLYCSLRWLRKDRVMSTRWSVSLKLWVFSKHAG